MVGVEKGREFRFRGDLYSQESTFPLVLITVARIILKTLDTIDCLHTFIAPKCGRKRQIVGSRGERGTCPGAPQLATPGEDGTYLERPVWQPADDIRHDDHGHDVYHTSAAAAAARLQGKTT